MSWCKVGSERLSQFVRNYRLSEALGKLTGLEVLDISHSDLGRGFQLELLTNLVALDVSRSGLDPIDLRRALVQMKKMDYSELRHSF